MKKVVRLTESDIARLVTKVLNEQTPTTKPTQQKTSGGPGPKPAPTQQKTSGGPGPKPAAQRTLFPLKEPIKIAVYSGKQPYYYDLTGIEKVAKGCRFHGKLRGDSKTQVLFWTNATPLTVTINGGYFKITEKASGLLIKACGTNEYAAVQQGGESNYA
jgi:hypothetical protein